MKETTFVKLLLGQLIFPIRTLFLWKVSVFYSPRTDSFIISQHTGRSLDVSIVVSPPGVIHQAASSLNLTCGVSGQSNAQLSYQWMSTCTGNCFVLGSRVSNLLQTALHSIDSGNHTCSVSDMFGNRGIATIQIVVVGKLFKQRMCL